MEQAGFDLSSREYDDDTLPTEAAFALAEHPVCG